MIKSIQTKYYLQAIALRSNNEQHTEHIDNAYFYIVELERRNRIAVSMLREKEKELILRAAKLSELESEVRRLKTNESVLNERIDTLETINKNLIKSIEKDFDNIKAPKI